MANTLTIAAPSNIGGSTSYLELRFTVTSGATTISDTYYYFHANDFGSVYDTSSPNMAVLQLGANHVFTMTNGDYGSIIYGGVAQTNVVAAALSIVTAIAPFTT